MQKAISFYLEHFYDIMIPLSLFCIFRVGMSLAELKRMHTLRVKKQKFLSVCGKYTDIGAYGGALIGFALCVAFKDLWPIFLLLAVVLCFIGYKIGRKKGLAADAELRRMMEALQTEEETPALNEETISAEPAEDE